MKCKFLIQLTLTSKCAVIIYVALYFLLSFTVNHIKGDYDILCQSPASAGRDSTWRCERCRWETEAASQFFFFGLPVYFKLMILFYTFTKTLGQRFDIFSSHWLRFIFLQKLLLPLKRSSFLSNSLVYFFSCVLVNTL